MLFPVAKTSQEGGTYSSPTAAAAAERKNKTVQLFFFSFFHFQYVREKREKSRMSRLLSATFLLGENPLGFRVDQVFRVY